MPVLQSFEEFHDFNHPAKSSIATMRAALAVLTKFAEGVVSERKIGVMFIILFVSLFAVSFPSLSKKVSFLRIHPIIFFIGKHFGTGVILATAFVHLLDDAFRSLQDAKVEEQYGNIRKWTGHIILASLLSIFLVEYASTSYVERLQEKPSAPPTPIPSRPTSRLSSPTSTNLGSPSRSRCKARKASRSRSGSKSVSDPHKFPPQPTAVPPLIPDLDSPSNLSLTRAPSAPVLPVQAHSHLNSQHHVHTVHHHHHHPHGPTIPASAVVGLPIEVLTNSPRICRLALAHDHVHGHHHHHIWEGDSDGGRQDVEGEVAEEVERIEHAHELEHEHEHEMRHTIGRRRQVVGLLVLQLGIMIHSLVIGLTLAVTSGSDFTSLTTAIIFHQLFEGFSLGIRIAALPPNRKKIRNTESTQKDVANGLSDLPAQSPTAAPERRIHDTERSSPGSPSTQHPALGDNSPVHANGTSKNSTRFTPHLTTASSMFKKSHRISGSLSSCRRWAWKMKDFEWFKPTLTLLFGVTTPFGMGLGMAVWSRRASVDPGEEGSMLLIQGVMSAISAGMLIYAATVEMIAADFVFGDVEGNHHHHHIHAHASSSNEEFHRDERDPHHHHHMDEERADERNGQSRTSLEESKQPTPVRKQILAVLSLFAGAGAMVLVGLGE